MDKMTIIGTDGKPKYILTEDNTVIDMRLYQHCSCSASSIRFTNPIKPYKIKGDEKTCPICNKPKPEENHG
jgi:hypothetical protein